MPSISDDNSETEYVAIKSIGHYLWNSKERTICDRTISSWWQNGIFYIFFYTIILGSSVFIVTTTKHYILIYYPDEPIIAKGSLQPISFPCLSFIPNIANVDSPLLWYRFSGKPSRKNMRAENYINRISNFMKKYDSSNSQREEYINCTVEKKDKGNICFFDREMLGPCAHEDYGYKIKQPCFFLKVNKLAKWIPEYYGEDLPAEMPQSLKYYIGNQTDKKYVWVSCEGESNYDKEYVRIIRYYPHPGFAGYYFPYHGSKRYISPIVAVKIKTMQIGVLINIECKMWARNIDQKSDVSGIFLKIFIDG